VDDDLLLLNLGIYHLTLGHFSVADELLQRVRLLPPTNSSSLPPFLPVLDPTLTLPLLVRVQVMKVTTDSIAYYHRQICLFLWSKLDQSLQVSWPCSFLPHAPAPFLETVSPPQEWSPDAELAPYVKEGLSKKIPRNSFSSAVRKDRHELRPNRGCPDACDGSELSEPCLELLSKSQVTTMYSHEPAPKH
jgi:hypothetical protein